MTDLTSAHNLSLCSSHVAHAAAGERNKGQRSRDDGLDGGVVMLWGNNLSSVPLLRASYHNPTTTLLS